jgi:hypothetical protein
MISVKETLVSIEGAAKRIKKTKFPFEPLDEFLSIVPYVWDNSQNYLFRAGEMVNNARKLDEANKILLETAIMDFYNAIVDFAKSRCFPKENENREGEIADLFKGVAKLFAKDEKTLCKKTIAFYDYNMDLICRKYGTIFDPAYDPKNFYTYKKDLLPVFVRLAVYGMAYDVNSLRDGGVAKGARNIVEKIILLSIIMEEEKARKLTIAEKTAPGRNDPCFCGSGKKYKHCCGR